MALLVEDGSGVAGANSYATLAFADAYFADYGAPDAWFDMPDAEQEMGLRMGFQYLETKYGTRWCGERRHIQQTAAWPRYLVPDPESSYYYLDSVSVPVQVIRAQCEMGKRWLNDRETGLWPDATAGEDNVISESITVGSISNSVQYAGTRGPEKAYEFVDAMLRGLYLSGGTVERA